MTGSSLGAGLVKVFNVNGLETSFSGSYHTLLVLHQDRPGVIAEVARVIAADEGNIATIFSMRARRGGDALLAVEIDRRPAQYALDYLTHIPFAQWLRMLPVVMEDRAPVSSILERTAEES